MYLYHVRSARGGNVFRGVFQSVHVSGVLSGGREGSRSCLGVGRVGSRSCLGVGEGRVQVLSGGGEGKGPGPVWRWGRAGSRSCLWVGRVGSRSCLGVGREGSRSCLWVGEGRVQVLSADRGKEQSPYPDHLQPYSPLLLRSTAVSENSCTSRLAVLLVLSADETKTSGCTITPEAP